MDPSLDSITGPRTDSRLSLTAFISLELKNVNVDFL